MEQATPRSQALQQLIGAFISNRLTDKLDKLSPDDPKRSELTTQYQPPSWLADAARRVTQLQLVTHPQKSTHPDARGSSLFAPPASLPLRLEIGTHSLGDFASDVVGNAAALDVYKFLKLEYQGQTLLQLMQANDSDVLQALHHDGDTASQWCAAFCSITEPAGGPAAHGLAKQIYWPVSPDDYPADANDDSHYHLLSILNSSALSHWLYGRIQEHRFGEAAKAARQARRDGSDHPHGYHDYPQLAEEKKGGTKPQNISQLNSERRGSNYLLAALPPRWDSTEIRPLYQLDNAFERFGKRKAVRSLLREFGDFLSKLKPEHNNIHIRQRRAHYLAELFSELLQFGAAYSNSLPPGWTATTDCQLPIAQQCWLDPYRAEQDADFNLQFQWQDWPQQLAAGFAYWLNRRLEGKGLHLAEAEFDYWRRELAQDAGWQGQLDQLQQGVQA